MIRAAAITTMLAMVLASPAAGEEPGAFCSSLGRIVEAASSATPFGALAPNLAAGQSMGKAEKLPGFEDASGCSGYMAGTIEKGTVGGGPYNYIECRYFRDDTRSNPKAVDDAHAAIAALTAKVEACTSGLGWTKSSPWPFSDRSGLKGTRYVTRTPEVDAVVFLESRRTGRSASSVNTYYETKLRIRSPNHNHPHERTD